MQIDRIGMPPEDFVRGTAFFLTQSAGEQNGRRYTEYEFRLKRPETPSLRKDMTATVRLPECAPDAAPEIRGPES
jgi:hypothetical protein